MKSIFVALSLLVALAASPVRAEEPPKMTAAEEKAWNEHWDGVARAFVGGMEVLAQKAITSASRDVSNGLGEIAAAVKPRPVVGPTWHLYTDGYFRTYVGGHWYIWYQGRAVRQ